MAQNIKTTADLLEDFKDGQPANSIDAENVRNLIISAPNLLEEVYGWEFLYDDQYTQNSPLSVPNSGWTRMTNNGARADLRYPSDFPGTWDKDRDILKPAVLNGFGIVRVSLTAYANSGTNNYMEIEVNTGLGSPIVSGSPLPPGGDWIFKETGIFIKGTGVGNHEHFNFIMPLFVGTDFATLGACIHLSCPTGTGMSVYDIAITAHRTFAPNPAA